MNIRNTLLLALSLANASLWGAQTWEVSAGAGILDTPFAGTETDLYMGSLEAFIDPLTLNSAEPLREAAFVERPRSLRLSLTRLEHSYEDAAWSERRVETTAGLAYTHRRPTSPHAFRIGYDYSKSTFKVRRAEGQQPGPSFDVSDATDTFSLDYLHYIRPRLTLGIESSYEHADSFDILDVALAGRLLHPIGGDRWLMLAASVGRIHARNTFGQGEYQEDFERDYTRTTATGAVTFSRRTSLGATWHYDTEAEWHTAGIFGEHFFNESFAVGASVERTFLESMGDPTTTSAHLRWRF